MSDTKEFAVFQVARSDGADTGPGYWPNSISALEVAAAGPKKSAAAKDSGEKTGRTKAQMVRLDESDPRFVEFCVKMGILLKQELCPTPDEGLPWYFQFPRGYWLYEKSKHLWVSGYPIKAKLFKSVQEFAVHLIWLATSSTEYRDCCCVHCNLGVAANVRPDSLVVAAPVAAGVKPDARDAAVAATATTTIAAAATSTLIGNVKSGATKAPDTAKTGAKAQKIGGTPTIPQAARATPVVPPPQQQPQQPQQPQQQPQQQQQQKQQQPPQQQPQPQPQPQPQQPQPQTQTQQRQQPQLAAAPSPLAPQGALAPQAPIRTAQPQHPSTAAAPAVPAPLPGPSRLVPWRQPSDLLFRTGEMVWYQMLRNWRIGLIVGPCSHPNYPSQRSVELIPLGHASSGVPNVAKMVAEMRPFHAFTVPPTTIPEIRTLGFDDVPWDSYLSSLVGEQARPRHDMILLDASKLAALRINLSHSLFSPLDDQSQPTARWGGLFLGPERIEIGDVIRVQRQPPPNVNPNTADEPTSALLGVREILTNSGSPGALFIRGTEYNLLPLASDADAASLAIVPPEHLPAALREEITWRERVRQAVAATAAPPPRHVVVLVNDGAIHRETSIRGRWYPTNHLMPITRPDAFQEAVQKGHVDDTVTYLNNRVDSLGQHYIGRVANRVAAAGAAIPPGRGFAFEPQIREAMMA